jgi:hypothetical protein
MASLQQVLYASQPASQPASQSVSQSVSRDRSVRPMMIYGPNGQSYGDPAAGRTAPDTAAGLYVLWTHIYIGPGRSAKNLHGAVSRGIFILARSVVIQVVHNYHCISDHILLGKDEFLPFGNWDLKTDKMPGNDDFLLFERASVLHVWLEKHISQQTIYRITVPITYMGAMLFSLIHQLVVAPVVVQ